MEISRLGIVVPAYNEQKTIWNTLWGLYAQKRTDDNTTHIVADNCSTDATAKVVYRFAHDYDGFPVSIVNEEAKAQATQRRLGLTLQ